MQSQPWQVSVGQPWQVSVGQPVVDLQSPSNVQCISVMYSTITLVWERTRVSRGREQATISSGPEKKFQEGENKQQSAPTGPEKEVKEF